MEVHHYNVFKRQYIRKLQTLKNSVAVNQRRDQSDKSHFTDMDVVHTQRMLMYRAQTAEKKKVNVIVSGLRREQNDHH